MSLAAIAMMILIEFFGWVAFNRITPFTVPRASIAISWTGFLAVASICYVLLFHPLGINAQFIWIYGLGNAALAAMIGFTWFTFCESRAHAR